MSGAVLKRLLKCFSLVHIEWYCFSVQRFMLFIQLTKDTLKGYTFALGDVQRRLKLLTGLPLGGDVTKHPKIASLRDILRKSSSKLRKE